MIIRLAMIVAIPLIAASCDRVATVDAIASAHLTPQGFVVDLSFAQEAAEPLLRPGKQVYISLGRCDQGEDGMVGEGRSDQIEVERGRTRLHSQPFDGVTRLGPGMCTQLTTASMEPFAIHYRTPLIRLS